jgi:two-component system, sensor histidine kinase PdtaS
LAEPGRSESPSPAPETTASLLREIDVGAKKSVSLKRVVRERLVITEMSAAALLQPSLDSVLMEACRYAADGCRARFAKALEHRPEEGTFVVRAGRGWNPDVIGRARANDTADNPAGEAFRTRKPVTVWDVRIREDYRLPPIYLDHGIVSLANVPIIGSAGFYGVLEVGHPAERHFDVLDTMLLISIAGIVAESVERMKRESALRAAYAASALLLREHYHRVRNNFQTILGLVQLHARDAPTADSRKRIEEIGRRVFSLSSLYDHLLGTQASDRIELNGYLMALCERLHEFYRLDERPIQLRCATPASSASLDVDTGTTVGIVVNELVANALEHAFPNGGGQIEMVAQTTEAGDTAISVEDDGRGFQGAPPGGIGLAVARRLMSWIGGSLSLGSRPGGGTRWTLVVPKKRVAPPPQG